VRKGAAVLPDDPERRRIACPPVTQSVGLRVLFAASLLTLVLGSLHAFSVFVEPLEAAYGASRQSVSLTYSIALVSLTFSVLVGHRVYGVLRPAILVLAIGTGAVLGLMIAAKAGSLPIVWLGFGLVFGAANGFGYGFALQISAQANEKRAGMAMGIVTASYALGAAVSPLLLEAALADGGMALALSGLGLVLACTAPLSAFLLHLSSIRFRHPYPADDKVSADPPMRADKDWEASDPSVLRLWIGYGAGCAAGLMAIAHAIGIARNAGMPDAILVAAPITLALCNMAGGVTGGWMVDRLRARTVLVALAMMSAGAIVLLLAAPHWVIVLAGLALVGFAYGALIAAYPAAVATLFGTVHGVAVYGRVFTAWGLAGLAGPWLAGAIHDRFQDYFYALVVAGLLGIVSALSVGSLEDGSRRPD